MSVKKWISISPLVRNSVSLGMPAASQRAVSATQCTGRYNSPSINADTFSRITAAKSTTWLLSVLPGCTFHCGSPGNLIGPLKTTTDAHVFRAGVSIIGQSGSSSSLQIRTALRIKVIFPGTYKSQGDSHCHNNIATGLLTARHNRWHDILVVLRRTCENRI